MSFNKNARTGNAFKAAAVGTSNQIVNLVCGFVFRTVFLMVLSKEYLGLNGLFTNVLNVLSLAELGIAGAIIYRMYEPIALNNEEKVAQMMCFYKNIYRIIALIVTVIGLSILPAIKFLIKNPEEIPSDINIYVVYVLFLAQSVTSYLFVYKNSILTADQKGYINSACSMFGNILNTALRIAVLFITKDFIATLITGIVVSLTVNIVNSIIATKMYPCIFKGKHKLDKTSKKTILKDTAALACHKIGGVVVGSTDNILLSAFIGIGVLGIYSNYSLLMVAVAGLIGQLLGTFTSSVGNAKLNLTSDDFFKTYKRLLYINLVIVSCACVSMYCLLEPFITVWLDEGMLLDNNVVIVLIISYFLSQFRHVNINFTSATGLFRKDRLRPLIEAAVNLTASIVLVNYLGVMGIFLGTIISNLLVVFWREPYLLFKNEFKAVNKLWKYFTLIALFGAYTTLMSYGLNAVFNFMPNIVGYVILKFAICAVVPLGTICVLTFWTDEFKYFISLIKRVMNKVLRKLGKKES